MKSLLTTGLITIGVFILLIGFAMPATTTQTSTTCIDDPFGYGQDCIQSTYETPNSGRFGIIGLGIMTFIVGIISYSSDLSAAVASPTDSVRSDQSQSSGQSSSQESQSLKEQLQDYNSGEDSESTDEKSR